LVESWDGSQWSLALVPKPSGAVLNGVSCVSSVDCTAVGQNVHSGGALVESWNGTAWKVVANPESTAKSQLSGVSCISKTSCAAVGTYLKTGGGNRALVESWNGKRWNAQPIAVDALHHHSQLNAVTCASRTLCVAVGSEGSRRPPLIERWNGTSWKLQPNPGSADSFLLGASCASTVNCAAVGRSTAKSRHSPFAESWDGSNWSLEPSASSSHTSGTLQAVSCPSTSACTAVGFGPLAERWNGSSWSNQALAAPNGKAALFGVSCPSTSRCIAVGGVVPSGSHTLNPLAEMWTQ
jgi:hypothetical protein